MTKEELLLEFELLYRYDPEYREGVDSDCPCCRYPPSVSMEESIFGEWVSVDDVRALLNRA